MEISKIVDELSDEEKRIYWTQSANDYFRNIKYSKEFINISKKLESEEELTFEQWDYIIKRLFLVTCKALNEEDQVKFSDKVVFMLSKIGKKISVKNGYLYNECIKMIEFINSIEMEKEINSDLVDGLDKISNSRENIELSRLLKQHGEASIFRDNQDAYFEAYDYSEKGYISESERVYINTMYRSYIREKKLVNECNK